MTQERDEGYGDTHCDEDYSDFRQGAPCESAYLRVSGVLQYSDNDEGNPRCLKEKKKKKNPTNLTNWKINAAVYIATLNSMNPVLLLQCGTHCKEESQEQINDAKWD